MPQRTIRGRTVRQPGLGPDSPVVLLTILVVVGLVTVVSSVLLLGATLAVTAGMNPLWRFVVLLVVLAAAVTIPVFLVGRSRPLAEL